MIESGSKRLAATALVPLSPSLLAVRYVDEQTDRR
jgi:hypothetical protein